MRPSRGLSLRLPLNSPPSKEAASLERMLSWATPLGLVSDPELREMVKDGPLVWHFGPSSLTYPLTRTSAQVV